MKLNIFTLLVIVMLQSCSDKADKNKLIGNWSIANGHTEFEFYQDSVIIVDLGQFYINEWSLDDSKLYLHSIKGIDSSISKNIVFEYKLNKNTDTLFLKKPKDSLFKFPIVKIKSAFDYLQKQNRLFIDLPIEDNLMPEPNQTLGLNIYLGFRNGELFAKSDDDRHRDLENIKFFCYVYLARNQNDSTDKNLHFNLIADKNVPAVQIDSIKNILTETGFKNIFRIYTNKKVDYNITSWKDELIWYGKLE